MSAARRPAAALAEDGHALMREPLPRALLDAAARSMDDVLGDAAGSRRLLDHPACCALADRLRHHLVAQGVLAPSTVAVQCTLFDKTPRRNWPEPSRRRVLHFLFGPQRLPGGLAWNCAATALAQGAETP